MKLEIPARLKNAIPSPYALGLVFVMAAATIITMVVSGPQPPMRPDLQHLPIYPGARNVAEKEETLGYVFATWRVITFETSDEPEDVFAFYRKAMYWAGWKPSTLPVSTDHEVDYTYAYRTGRRSGTTRRST